jgi:hypothetical protein
MLTLLLFRAQARETESDAVEEEKSRPVRGSFLCASIRVDCPRALESDWN